MFGLDIAFDSPWYLLLMGMIPVLWVASFRSLSGLGRWRRLVALVLRTAVLALVVLAIAETQMVRMSDKITVIYLLDQSASIPESQRDAMRGFVRESVQKHRDNNRHDRSAVITFGLEAFIEYPPIDDDPPLVDALESAHDLRIDATNLESALKLALATFPEDGAKRIVLVSDGNENLGDALSVAQMMAKDSVGIDIVPVVVDLRGEVAVEKVSLPSDIRRGQPFEVRVVVNNMTEPTAESDGHVSGMLRLVRRQGSTVVPLAEVPLELPPGKQVFAFDHEILEPSFYEYEAMFVPDDADDDVMPQNNQATAYTHVQGKGQVLVIEDWQNAGQFEYLIGQLRRADLEVTMMTTDQLFSSLADLQQYDTVLLADVPRFSDGANDSPVGFDDPQISMLVRNTQQMGSGLVMLGGPSSFGAGGWGGTELEEAMPVDFRITNAKVEAVGALAMVMHASEMAEGNHWQKVIGTAALESLGNQDYCGVIEWNGREKWLWSDPQGMQPVGPNRRTMLSRMGRMIPGDMPDFDPGMQLADREFARLSAPGGPRPAVKHMIIISDGDPTPPSRGVIQRLINQGVTISTVAVGTHRAVGPGDPLPSMAARSGGKFYNVTSAQALPRIFQREARRVARPLVKEFQGEGVPPNIVARHEVLQGIEGPLPHITGFVMTTVKENPLVEVAIVSPDPPGRDNATVLATWTYGVGRTAVFTTDAGNRWAHQWTEWPNYEKFFTQLVQWSMRPTSDTGNFTVATEIENGRVKIIATALDENDEFINFLDFRGFAVDPQFDPLPFSLEQVAPGRYVGEFESDESGSYFITLLPGSGHAPIRAGVDVPYSAEYRVRSTNEGLLASLVSLEPAGGEPGRVAEGPLVAGQLEALLSLNPFRPDLPRAASGNDIWPLLVLVAACLFFADVFIRRVNVSFAWVPPVAAQARDYLLGREQAAKPDERLERLRSRKAEISQEVDRQRAAVRFEPEQEATFDPADALGDATSPGRRAAPPPAAGPAPQQQAEEETYMDRLLKAKQQARRQQKPPSGSDK